MIYSGFFGYLAINLILIPFGIMGFNAIQWYFEYRADILSYQITRDLDSAIRFLEKIKRLSFKRQNMFFELLAYTHPSPERRIEKLKNVSFKELT